MSPTPELTLSQIVPEKLAHVAFVEQPGKHTDWFSLFLMHRF